MRVKAAFQHAICGDPAKPVCSGGRRCKRRGRDRAAAKAGGLDNVGARQGNTDYASAVTRTNVAARQMKPAKDQ